MEIENESEIGVKVYIGPFLFVINYELKRNKKKKYSLERFIRTGNFKIVYVPANPLDNHWYEPEYVPDEHNPLDNEWFRHEDEYEGRIPPLNNENNEETA